ncbi:MAG: class I SAM-dependent methyltransferase [Ferruginibacter sp.]|nr:class I SAM-dependent methyltransferase [Ferruginibacter sp.]
MDTYKETFETWNKLAHLYKEKFMDLDLYDDTYDAFCNHLQVQKPAILEIGCGPGNITRYLLNTRPDLRMEGIDISPNMIAIAKANNPTADFKVMDCREIDKLQRKFDGIVCGFCLPYLSASDSSKMLKDCATLLNSNGTLYISFVEGNCQDSGFKAGSTGDRTYFYSQTLSWLTNELKNNNFKITKLFNKHYNNTSGTPEVHTILIASK